MAPKKQLQRKGSAKVPSKSAPKLQISAENERRLRRLLLNTDRPSKSAAVVANPAAADTVASRTQRAKRLRGVYDKLSLEGFTPDQIEQALSALNVGYFRLLRPF
ncbi:hypothetical protein AXF42_Ash002139 [Apostasia shenzhenica]|uniref:Uncharacterized protein n=1 Tax=Apostasia shenzhenica TaxID=1088818 RepID=A0A2I0AMZ6_9ASPA|nr:hypothetical protein AXF42_Ash002139 [Apostasia shenzhenica]